MTSFIVTNMSFFLEKLEKVLLKFCPEENLGINNGFCLSYYASKNKKIKSKIFGSIVEQQKEIKYFSASSISMANILNSIDNAIRGYESCVLDEAFFLKIGKNYFAASVSSKYGPEINQAIAILWLTAKLIDKKEIFFETTEVEFLKLVISKAETYQKEYSPKNILVSKIAFLMADDGGK